MPRRLIAIGAAALATAASGAGALVTAEAPAAAHAGCVGDFQSRTEFNRSQNAPRIYNQPPVIGIYEGNVLLFTTNESQYTFLLLDCVNANPASAL